MLSALFVAMGIVAIVLSICSLTLALSANIARQKPHMAVLRSLGLTVGLFSMHRIEEMGMELGMGMEMWMEMEMEMGWDGR